jgi:hypothetical protein
VAVVVEVGLPVLIWKRLHHPKQDLRWLEHEQVPVEVSQECSILLA